MSEVQTEDPPNTSLQKLSLKTPGPPFILGGIPPVDTCHGMFPPDKATSPGWEPVDKTTFWSPNLFEKIGKCQQMSGYLAAKT